MLYEFVNCSIEATQDPSTCPTRDINMYFLVNQDRGYVIIHDNDCGMTLDQFRLFARYDLLHRIEMEQVKWPWQELRM